MFKILTANNANVIDFEISFIPVEVVKIIVS